MAPRSCCRVAESSAEIAFDRFPFPCAFDWGGGGTGGMKDVSG